MRTLPLLNPINKQKSTIGIFGGINRLEAAAADNEFSEMTNMSSDAFPAMCPRNPRGEVIKTLEKPHGLYWKNGLAYVDGTEFWYKDEKVADVEDSDKKLVGMGAYIVMLPDKTILNTSTGEYGSMEATWEQPEGTTATFEPTYDASVYTRIKCTGIGKNFSQGDGVTISGCTNEAFNKSAILQNVEDDAIVVINQISETFTQSSGLVIKREMPDMDFITEADNRLWGCSSEKHEVYASKLGDPKNWNCFEGISTDSYAATVGSDGDFTGCITHMGTVLFFKEDYIHKVFGNKPSNIQINTYPFRGVAKGAEKSLCIVNETLYYAARFDIVSYEGSLPESISEKLGELRIEDATAEQYNNKYYISVKTPKGSETYVYDTFKKLWHREDDTFFKYAEYAEGKLYIIDQDNNLREIEDPEGEEKVCWEAASVEQSESDLNKKRITHIQILAEIEPETLFEVYMQYDSIPVWERVYTKRSIKKESVRVTVNPRKCDYFRWRIKGEGKFAVYALAKTVKHGSPR